MAKSEHADILQHTHSWQAKPSIRLALLCILASGILGGCVSSEKYESEKARALNFQRLLAQEEKRTGELNSQVQATKRQLASIESQNKDLTIELEALRDQMSRQESQMGSMAPDSSSPGLSSSQDLSLSEPSLSEFGLSDLSFNESDFKDFGEIGGGSGDSMGGEPTYYTVVRGDTLYRISREYGVTVNQLKEWNNLTSNDISVGQKLAVSRP
ncbi:LysM peptidoglycan-binding domain-containing protein [Candidatus Nitronereus thalassa]|uniref:LysM peptidoglycan-binding domain-containing protein n=1 Tax=Candidatus Nitronereus thalassa TaxID=3020898 RepID=A0ABU3K4M7_9BACT|nr:LysM peptidoglycan-binding domain-containing protein [Candidatus Nitronereus thalassa]MDT7041317.1 LysM peptidoglycan-binding domain-containing protein [Candidatus Nitronereus thalassa]